MKTACIIEYPDLQSATDQLMPEVHKCVENTTRNVVLAARSLAPKRTGALRVGIVGSPWEEKSKRPNKVARQVYFDEKMNDVFVKIGKNGKRYYYPASQEYGFLKKRPGSRGKEKHPGVFFMRNARDVVSVRFAKDMENIVRKVAEDD